MTVTVPKPADWAREGSTTRRRSPRASVRLRYALAWLPALAAIAALTQVRHVWAAEAALLMLLLIVPGRLLLRALWTPGEAIVETPLYVPAASLVVLLAAGAGVDLIGPLLGVATPLRTLPMLVGVEGLCLLLLLVGLIPRPEPVAIPWRLLELRARRAWPLLLPLVAGAGALRLTDGGGAALAIAGTAAAGVLLLAGLAIANRASRSQLSLIVYGAGLALAWSFSLRGHLVYGWDITAEYHVAAHTWAQGIWRTPHPSDAYGAMLSLTVLPATLHALTGITSLPLLKAVYPALLALFPVAVFSIARRHLRPRYAFLAAAFVVVQSYFFQQMPTIARQEIGLVLFVVLIAAVLDQRLPRRSQVPLVALLAGGIVVSHYTTTYLTAAFFGIAIVLQLVVSVFRKITPVSAAVVAVFAVSLAGGIAWNGVVTHSSSNVKGFQERFQRYGFNFLPNAKPGENLLGSYLSGNVSTRIPAARYEQLAAQKYKDTRPYVKPLPAGSDPRYTLRDASVPAPPVRSPQVMEAASKGQLYAAQLFNLIAVLGALVLVVRRRGSQAVRQVGLLALATLGVLAFVRLSGTAAASYNQERAFLQTMVPLSLAAAWLLQQAAGRRRLAVPVSLLSLALLALMFAGNSGLRGKLLGGGTPANLSNGGEDYERFVVDSPELAAAQYLGVAPRRSLIYADIYGQLRVLATSGRVIGLLVDPTPATLDQHAWVYGSRANVVDGRGRGTTLDNRYALYRWPGRYLSDYYDTVYANGSSTVYHR